MAGGRTRNKVREMPEFSQAIVSGFAGRYSLNAKRIHELADPLTDTQLWQKAFPFGNSCGHLVLHLTGNLNYYIGAQIAKTGYVRDRPREFNESAPPSKEETLKRFDDAVDMVLKTIHAQSAEDWSEAYSGAGTDAKTRFDIVMICAAHMQLHIGQMIYLVYEVKRRADKGAD
jgi:uncharacterized damage-inducible protein DinB